MSCREDHVHDHEDHNHDHDHDHEDAPGSGQLDNLYSQIDRDNVKVLNSEQDGKEVIKPWHERDSIEKYIQSDDDDPQLLFYIPFTGIVKLRSILIKTGPGDMAASELKLFVNRDDMDFSAAESDESTHTLSVAIGVSEVTEYTLRVAKFSNVRSISIFIPSNQGGRDVTRVYYIGFRGEWTQLSKDPVITMYEASANPADHAKISEVTNKVQQFQR